jgi:hypothetical protein
MACFGGIKMKAYMFVQELKAHTYSVEQLEKVFCNKRILFEYIAAWLLRTNGKKCVDGGGTCLYRNDDKNMCAVGAVIPDSMYCDDMEGNSIEGVAENIDFIPNYIKGDNVAMLTTLQRIHDQSAMWEVPSDACRRTAIEALRIAFFGVPGIYHGEWGDIELDL